MAVEPDFIMERHPSEILSNSSHYLCRFDQIYFHNLQVFKHIPRGSGKKYKEYSSNLPEGIIIPTSEGEVFKGLPLPKKLADVFGITRDKPYRWRLGLDIEETNLLMLFPEKRDDDEFIIRTKSKKLAFENQNDIIIEKLHIWHEPVLIRQDIDPLTFKVPNEFLRPLTSDVPKTDLMADRPAFLLFHDDLGNLFYFRACYTEAGYHQKYQFPALLGVDKQCELESDEEYFRDVLGED